MKQKQRVCRPPASPNFKPTVLALALSMAVMSEARGATIEVTSPLDDGTNCTLREAVVSVNNAALETGCLLESGTFGVDDTIIFANNVSGQTLELSSRVEFTKSVTVNPGGAMTVIELGAGQFYGKTGATEVTFDQLTLEQGSSNSPFQFSTGSLNLSNCLVHGDSAYLGAGVFAPDTDVTISGSEISGFSGLAVFVNRGTVNILDSKLTENGAGGFSGVGVTLTVRDSEITHNSSASSPGAPGIKAGGTIEITDTTLAHNTATAGINGHAGGLSLGGGTVTLRNVTVEHNTVGGRGGGIRLYGGGPINIYDSTIRYNTAGILGGGVQLPQDGDVTFHQSRIHSNTATFFGGGIAIGDFSAPTPPKVTLLESTVSGNTADQGGGAFVVYGASLALVQSTISSNTSVIGGGGGIFTRSLGEISMVNSTLSGNSATTIGGGFYNNSALIDLTNSTVANNSATTSGGGMYNTGSSTINLTNTVLSNPAGGDCAGQVISTDSFSWIEDDSCSGVAAGNPRLADLADNGGLTLTHAPLSGSPLIDAGDSAVCALSPVNNLDQRSEVRPIGSDCDIGSIEASSTGQFYVIPTQNGRMVIFEL